MLRTSLSRVTMLYFQIMLFMASIHLLTWPPPADLLNSCTRKSQNDLKYFHNFIILKNITNY